MVWVVVLVIRKVLLDWVVCIIIVKSDCLLGIIVVVFIEMIIEVIRVMV